MAGAFFVPVKKIIILVDQLLRLNLGERALEKYRQINYYSARLPVCATPKSESEGEFQTTAVQQH